jgi:malonate-semialdehyde dehydrogenase (acetylating) / methylmalonate-semialdehyde dehydrogenase
VNERPEVGQSSLREIGHFIDGVIVAGDGRNFAEVFDPAIGTVEARVSLASERELEVLRP